MAYVSVGDEHVETKDAGFEDHGTGNGVFQIQGASLISRSWEKQVPALRGKHAFAYLLTCTDGVVLDRIVMRKRGRRGLPSLVLRGVSGELPRRVSAPLPPLRGRRRVSANNEQLARAAFYRV